MERTLEQLAQQVGWGGLVQCTVSPASALCMQRVVAVGRPGHARPTVLEAAQEWAGLVHQVLLQLDMVYLIQDQEVGVVGLQMVHKRMEPMGRAAAASSCSRGLPALPACLALISTHCHSAPCAPP